MANDDFFEEVKEQSLIKTKIVAKYFSGWANIIVSAIQKHGSQEKVGYVDLFSGPGKYSDGKDSTPLIIAKKILKEPKLRQNIKMVFNDEKTEFIQSLINELKSLSNIQQLTHKPQFYNEIAGSNQTRKMLEKEKLPPILLFADPWGYKGLSLDLFEKVLKHWGSEVIFFFNYRRINAALSNSVLQKNMIHLFGEERTKLLSTQLENQKTYQREKIVIEGIKAALKGIGGSHVLDFKFKNDAGTRTTHHLIFVTKNIKGYTLMKEIMVKESSSNHSLEFDLKSKNQPLLFDFIQPISELKKDLLEKFEGQTLKMKDIFHLHHVNTNYIEKDYKTALKQLEKENKIQAKPPREQRKKDTFGKDVKVSFPIK